MTVISLEDEVTLTEEQKIEKMIEAIREVISNSVNEAEAIGIINNEVDGATFKGLRPNGGSGSLKFFIEIEVSNSTKQVSVTRRFPRKK